MVVRTRHSIIVNALCAKLTFLRKPADMKLITEGVVIKGVDTGDSVVGMSLLLVGVARSRKPNERLEKHNE